MDLLETIEQGNFQSYGKPQRMVDTLLSKLFFFDGYVLKVYKHEKAFYGDLTDFNFRREFYSEDFFWNHAFAPEIYLELSGAKGSSLVPFDEGEDFLIKMAIIDDTQNLTNLLTKGSLSVQNLQNMTSVLTEKLRLLTKQRKEKLSHLFQRGWLELQAEDLEDLRQWAYLAEEHIPKETTDEIVDLLNTTVSKDPYFIQYDESLLSVAIDNNCDNLLFLDGKPSFIDIMTPKENWRVSDEYFNIVRTAVDAYTLGNEELGDSVYSTYSKYRELPPQNVTLVYEIRSALIQWAYRHAIDQHDLGERFKEFTLERHETLKTAR